MPKQTKSSNTSALKGFILTLAILVLAVCVMAAMTNGFTNWNPYGWFDDKPADEQKSDGENNAPIDATITNGEHVTLTMSAATTAADGEYVEQVLTATVTPESAEDAGIDWTAAWADGSDSSDLSTYLTITPASDGSNVLYVRAYAAFEKDIIITATTRDGGFTATCTVKFVGNPSEMEINLSGLTAVQDSGWGKQIYQVKTSQTYTLDITLSNIFNKVNPAFVPNYKVELTGVGTFNLTKKTNGGNPETLTVSPSDVLTYRNTSTGRDVNFSISDQVLSTTIEGTQLKILPYGVINAISYKAYTDSSRTNYIQYIFDSYTDASKVPYYELTVTETNTGISKTINLRVASGVNGVSLDHSSMTF